MIWREITKPSTATQISQTVLEKHGVPFSFQYIQIVTRLRYQSVIREYQF